METLAHGHDLRKEIAKMGSVVSCNQRGEKGPGRIWSDFVTAMEELRDQVVKMLDHKVQGASNPNPRTEMPCPTALDCDYRIISAYILLSVGDDC